MMTPKTIEAAARVALALGAALLIILLLGPFQGAERLFGLTDKEAHASAFGLLTFATFIAFPRVRRLDMLFVLIAVGGAMELAQAVFGRDGDINDLLADAFGCLAIYLPSRIEEWRKLARERGFESFAAIRASDRRRRRSAISGRRRGAGEA